MLVPRAVSNQCSTAVPSRTSGFREVCVCAFIQKYVCRKVMGRMLAHSAHFETGITSRLAELTCRSASLEGYDALIEWRVAHEQLLDPLRDSAIDAEGRKLLGKRLRGMRTLERFERADHRARAGEISAACIRAKFTLPRKPRDDHAGKKAEHQLRNHDGGEVANAGAAALVVSARGAVDQVADDA